MTADPNVHAQPLVVEVAVSNLTQGMNIGVFGLLCFVQLAACETDWSLTQRSRPGACLIVCDLETLKEAV